MELLKELYAWVEKGKVYQTSGDYAKGWNDSIDTILKYMENLITQEENIAKVNYLTTKVVGLQYKP